MQIHNPNESSGITVERARKPRLLMAFTVSGVLIAGCAVLLGQPGNAQSDRFEDAGSVVLENISVFDLNAAMNSVDFI